MKKVIYDKDGNIKAICKSEGCFIKSGRKAYDLDDEGNERLTLAMSFGNELDGIDIDEADLPKNVETEKDKYKVDKDKKIKLKDAK